MYKFKINRKNNAENNAMMILAIEEINVIFDLNSFNRTMKVDKQGKYKETNMMKVITWGKLNGSSCIELIFSDWLAITKMSSFLKKPKSNVEPNSFGNPKMVLTIGEKIVSIIWEIWKYSIQPNKIPPRTKNSRASPKNSFTFDHVLRKLIFIEGAFRGIISINSPVDSGNNFERKILLIDIMRMIYKKITITQNGPVKAAERAKITVSLALQGINGINIAEIILSLRFAIILVA